MFMSLIIVLCDVCLFKVKWVFPLKFTFTHICINNYVFNTNYWLYVVFLLFSFLFHAVFVLGLWAMYAECLNKRMFCSVLFWCCFVDCWSGIGLRIRCINIARTLSEYESKHESSICKFNSMCLLRNTYIQVYSKINKTKHSEKNIDLQKSIKHHWTE